ncbi:hypothetical protein QUF74_18150 [Candidatus Halobeggiatoa sp. HSG11]|nr:hypothetical protein [Candidatus Halobeggiatoa sp. HSG11]
MSTQPKSQKEEQAVFKLFSLGVSTNRDEWVYDLNITNLENKIQFFIKEYNQQLKDYNGEVSQIDTTIAWSRDLKKKFVLNKITKFGKENFRKAVYRPFITKEFYLDYLLIDVKGLIETFFPNDKKNIVICITFHKQVPFVIQVVNTIFDAGIGSRATQSLPLYYYSNGKKIDNITDWGLNQFQNHYQDQTITKQDIFHYTYAVLHNPAYRQKYQLNLKREFPRLPYYDNFQQWVAWGQKLMDQHINYEAAKKYKLKRIDIDSNKANKPKLKADKEAGKIHDEFRRNFMMSPERPCPVD